MTLTLLGVLIAFAAQELDRKAEVSRADLAALAVAAAVAAAGVLSWLKRSFPAPSLRTTNLEMARQTLAEQVEQQWKTESRLRVLDDPEPMPIAWRLTGNAAVMSQPHLITAGDPPFSARADDIADLTRQFRALKRRRLIITGDGGMGKTTLAVQLLLELLASRKAEQPMAPVGEIIPVPVLLPVSGWDCRAHPRLHDWLGARLAQDYPLLTRPEFGPGAAAALARGHHILPILDGLDELSEQDRVKVIKALNASMDASDQVVLTCRKGEFLTAIAQLGRAINGAAVISPERLTAVDAANYLTACLPGEPPEAWRGVLAALTDGVAPSLAQVASTPLGLWLIRVVYIDTNSDPTPLIGPLNGDPALLHTHLLDLLIPALIEARPASSSSADHFRPRRQLNAVATRRYLTYLANHFHPDTTRDITWWHIPYTVPHLRVAAGITAGLITGIVFGLGGRLAFGLMTALAAGLVGGFIGGLTACGSWVDEAPGHAPLRPCGRTTLLFQSMRSNLAFGLTFGVTTTLALGLEKGAVFGLEITLMVGLVFGLVEWAEQSTRPPNRTPRSPWGMATGFHTLFRALLAGAAATLTVGLGGVHMTTGLGNAITGGLAIGLVIGLAGGLGVGLGGGFWGRLGGGLGGGNHHAWLACTLAVARLVVTRRLPLRIMDFLDDAHRLGLLRAVGPVYQFRHAALHDHLAGVPATSGGQAGQ
ncbi:NACHT domain-containing protein [Nonomuraea sp. NPDC059007]|uniref:NACHT domain-containing protein n=1 Tax=Nonomuraea sp. NPDC059007 TaxID=3346692 RepID=UPI0036CA1BCD